MDGKEAEKALKERKETKGNEDKWISVKDRLPDPKEYDWVLGALKTTELPKGCNYYLVPHIIEYRNGEWCAMDSDFPLKDLFEEVTHWMPLPELPKESEVYENG